MTLDKLIGEIEVLVPNYKGALRGADDRTIQHLEQAAGRRFAPIYKDFLAQMGEKLGRTLLNATFCPEHLLEYYRASSWRPVERYTLIGLDCGGSGEDVFLDAELTGLEGPAIVVFPKGMNPEIMDEESRDEYYHVVSESLPQLIFDSAFLFEVLAQHRTEVRLTKLVKVDGAKQRALSCLDRLGLTRHPRSHAARSFYLGPELAVYLHHEEALEVRIGGSTPEAVGRVAALLEDHLQPLVVTRQR